MEGFLTECVHESLNAYLHGNAIFLGERLFAANASEENAFLLATCYLRNNQEYRAYHVLKGATAPQSRYLFALCCSKLGKLSEAEHALCYSCKEEAEVPNGAAGHYLLGLICKQSERRSAAVNHFTQALTLDPFLWSAYEELCLLGADEEAATLLHNPDLDLAYPLNPEASCNVETAPSTPAPINTPLDRGEVVTPATTGPPSPRSRRPSAPPPPARGTRTQSSTAEVATPRPSEPRATPSPSTFVTPSPSTSSLPAAPPPNPPGKHGNAPANRGGPGASTSGAAAGTPASGQRRKFDDDGKLRKVSGRIDDEGKLRKVSGRLFAEPPPSVSGLRRSSRLSGGTTSSETPGKPPVNRRGAQPSSPAPQSYRGAVASTPASAAPKAAAASKEPAKDPVSGEAGKATDGAASALQLIRILGDGFRQLCMYKCQDCIATLQQLPPEQYASGWVLCTLGRAYFEMVDYVESERAFDWARRNDPTRLEGLEVFSTVLWHLKKEVQLSFLAQEVIALDRLSPHAWCVMGNCFSLQKEHETALRFFQRALQLDPNFAYAHTLCGHEYFANEDFEKGLLCFRTAIRIDERHYNAWYGLGTIYYRQEKYENAEYHFTRALTINARSSVLHCYRGMALHALNRNAEALSCLQTAIDTDEKNPLAKFEKASVLMSEDRHEEALSELEALKECAPREASVFFLMGKIYKKLDKANQAMVSFSIALDLKPSSSDVSLIKSAIEKLTVPDDSEEEEL
ncbi:Cell division cycle protein 27 [Cymbomonas tetramitiformis]|uniref:Cell division cycle protein 27 n=1 Tax=Cymbomonas tetramitiformis TaxID=36881 RepID=A0AAE0C198_9CHLO|nr:Cell division cycle protein 27 [Cymbomonas tetramitiformis]